MIDSPSLSLTHSLSLSHSPSLSLSHPLTLSLSLTLLLTPSLPHSISLSFTIGKEVNQELKEQNLMIDTLETDLDDAGNKMNVVMGELGLGLGVVLPSLILLGLGLG
jgi:hypothetical protein